jgi:hypothetical protein
MNRLSSIRTGRKGRVALAVGAAAAAGLAIIGGATAANAGTAPAPQPATQTTGEAPTLVPVDGAPIVVGGDGAPILVPVDGAPTLVPVKGAPDLTKVRPGGAPHSVPIKPRIGNTTDELSLVEVPGAVADFDKVQLDAASAVDDAPQVIGESGQTTVRR